MEDIVSLTKRRGFIFRSSEIYNGYQGFFDFGPLGTELKRNIKERWSQRFIRERWVKKCVGLSKSLPPALRVVKKREYRTLSTFCCGDTPPCATKLTLTDHVHMRFTDVIIPYLSTQRRCGSSRLQYHIES